MTSDGARRHSIRNREYFRHQLPPQSELGQRVYNFGVNVLGLSGPMLQEEKRDPIGGDLPEMHTEAVPSTIAGGTNEIQRNIIATRGLGLPRG